MSSIRYRLVTLGPRTVLPLVEGVSGWAWFWGENFPLPEGKTLDTVQPEDLPLRADPGTPPAEIGPILMATGETEADAWRAAVSAGKWLPEPAVHREAEGRERETAAAEAA